MHKTVYKTYPAFKLKERMWPNAQIEKAPRWCSLDLYLGQQSLLNPMDINNKLKLFNTLIKLGFKEISISNPAINEGNKIFLERLIEEKIIPKDVSLQVTVPCREELITETVVLLKQLDKVILQLEVPCSNKFTTLIFNEKSQEFKSRALRSAKLIHALAKEELKNSSVNFSISLEDFMGTEQQFLLDLANELYNCFLPLDSSFIIHLPNTVDYGTPSQYADGVEWFIKHFSQANHCVFSTFSKNNRGNAVAACELALQAGATRVEGSLLGIGERAGNNDLIIMVLNQQSQNIDTGIKINHINDLAQTIKETTHTMTPIRHPYVGELSFTALSNYQQNLIYKGLAQYESQKEKIWDVPYLNLNPMDVGRAYESVNYQERDELNDAIIEKLSSNFGFTLPKLLAAEFSNLIKEKLSEKIDQLTAHEIRDFFTDTYAKNLHPIELKSINFEKATLSSEEEQLYCQAEIVYKNQSHELEGIGDGALDTLVNAISMGLKLNFDIADFYQHALTRGSNALAATYLKIVSDSAKGYWGVGLDSDGTLSAIKAFFNALNRSQQLSEEK